MVEKDIIGGIYHSINKYAKANNKYMEEYDKSKELSYLKYWDVKLVANLHDKTEYVIHMRNLR